MSLLIWLSAEKTPPQRDRNPREVREAINALEQQARAAPGLAYASERPFTLALDLPANPGLAFAWVFEAIARDLKV